ncbi:hypothetical protein D3C85_832000 [compost metagenome]
MKRIGGFERLGDDFGITHAAAGVGQATHADDFVDRERKVQARTLRQHGQAFGPLLTRPVGEWTLVEADPAFTDRQLTTQGSEQGAFAGTIGSQHAQHFTGTQLDIDVRQYRAVATTYQQVVCPQHQERPRTSRYRKNGAPISAVTMPMGNSAGANNKRAARSASNSRLAPASNDAGSNTR